MWTAFCIFERIPLYSANGEYEYDSECVQVHTVKCDNNKGDDDDDGDKTMNHSCCDVMC